MRKTEFIKNLENAKKVALGEGYMACMKDPEIVNIGTAETHLVYDFLKPKLENRSNYDEIYTIYNSGRQMPKLQEAIAKLFIDHFGIKDAQPDEVLVSPGIAFLVERIGLVLCEPGDVVLIPKPCYGCFEPDLQMCRCKVEYIDLDNLPPAPPANAKMLLLTNPGNPVGDLVPNQEKLLEWAYQNPDLQVVTDEVYALSNRKGEQFQSICANPKADLQRTHLFYGLSKDWGMSGFHIGFFWSKNKELYQMMKTSFGCYQIGGDTVDILIRIFSDYELRDKIIEEGRKRLTNNYNVCTQLLKEGGIPYRECDNSLFVMADLTAVCSTPEDELNVWRKLFSTYKVHILPGYNGFLYPQPGWFRVCFAMKEPVVREGISRLVKGYQEMKAEQGK